MFTKAGDVSRTAGTRAGAGGSVDVVGSVAESSRASADDPAVSPSRLMVITLTTGSDTNEGTTTALCDNQSGHRLANNRVTSCTWLATLLRMRRVVRAQNINLV